MAASSISPILPCGGVAPALETRTSRPPKASTTLAKAVLIESAFCHVADDRDPADRLGFLFRSALVHVEQRDLRACSGERFCGRGSDAAGCPGHRDDLAGERQRLRGAELCLLQRPVFHVEQVGLGQRLEAADRFRVRNRFDRGLGEIGSDPRVFAGAAKSVEAKPWDQHDAGQRIELAF